MSAEHPRIRAAMARPDRSTFVDLPSQDIDDLLQERDELLEALRAMVSLLPHPDDDDVQATVNRARAAIAKATGGAHG